MKNINKSLSVAIFLATLCTISGVEASSKLIDLGFTSPAQFEKFSADLGKYGKSVGVLSGLKDVSETSIASDASRYFEENNLNIFDNPFTNAIAGMDQIPHFKQEGGRLKTDFFSNYYTGSIGLKSKTKPQLLKAMQNAKKNIEDFKKRYDQSIKLISNLKGAKLKPTIIPGFGVTVTKNKTENADSSSSRIL